MQKTITTQVKPKFVGIKAQKLAILFSFFILPLIYVPVQIFRDNINNSTLVQYIVIPSILQTSDIFNLIITGTIGTIVFLSTKGIKDIFDSKYKFSTAEYKNALLLHRIIPRIMYAAITIFPTILGILLINAQLNFTLIKDPFITLVLVVLFIPSLMIGFFAGLHITFHEKGKYFDLNLAKTHLKSIEEKASSTEKIGTIMKAIKEYDDYVFYKIKMRVGNPELFYSKIAFENTDIDNLLKDINKKIELDDIELARYLRNEVIGTNTEIQVDKPRLFQIKEFAIKPRYVSIFGAIAYFVLQFTDASKIFDFIKKILDTLN